MNAREKVADILLKMPLYAAVPIDSSDMQDKSLMVYLRRGGVSFDAYCIQCKKDSHFKDYRTYGGSLMDDALFKASDFYVGVACTRNEKHHYNFYINVSDGHLTKIGQYPSLEDISGVDIDKYRAILGKINFAELRRATGLASHGIGIGAFVYLRRIFEKLIFEARGRQKDKADTTDDVEFGQKRMDEKIAALKDELPPSLVKNKLIYGILSKGIHELTEDECRAYFPIVRSAIIQMLEQDFQAAEARRLEAETEKQIAKIVNDLKNAGTAE